MITFAIPWLFWAAVAASLVVMGWHLLSVRQPRDVLLPTARFVPPTTASAVARQPRPSDLLLMTLRVFSLLCIGLALSGARCDGSRARHAHLVLVDAALPDSVIAADSARWHAVAGDTAVQWRRIAGMDLDPGVAVVQAFRAVPSLLQDMPRMESLDLTVLASAQVAERRVWDAWHARWPGRMQVTTPAGLREPASLAVPAVLIDVVGALRDDLVAVAFRSSFPAAQRDSSGPSLSVQVDRRDAPTFDVRTDVQVHWPIAGVPAGWTREDSAGVTLDTVGAISAGGQTLMGPFVRRAVPPASRDTTVGGWRSVAWWNDGVPAALARSRTDGTRGCEVQVAVAVASGSDLLLAPEARGLLHAFVMACQPASIPLSSLVTTGSPTTAERREPASAQQLRALTASDSMPMRSPWMLVLLALAAGALLLEWRVRS